MKTIQERAIDALADLGDLGTEIESKLVDYPKDGKISAIYTHNCIARALEVLRELSKQTTQL